MECVAIWIWNEIMTQSTTQSRSSFSRFDLFVMLGVALFGLVLFATMLVAMLGYVKGTEFSPEAFDTRTFSFYRFPWSNWQLTPIYREVDSPDLVVALRKKGFWSAAKPAKTWRLVRGIDGGRMIEDTDPSILMPYLESRTPGYGLTWEIWSDKHPAAAKWMWPLVESVVQSDLYPILIDIFQSAQRSDGSLEDLKAVMAARVEPRLREIVAAAKVSGSQERELAALRIISQSFDPTPDELVRFKELKNLFPDPIPAKPADQAKPEVAGDAQIASPPPKENEKDSPSAPAQVEAK